MCASTATSSRRSPGVRRRGPDVRPTSSGWSRSRRARRKAPSSVLSMVPVCSPQGGRSWYRLCLPHEPGGTKTEDLTGENYFAPVGLLTRNDVFIPGASRGIGAAATRLFAREGATVVAAARSTDALARLVAEIRSEGGSADSVAMDLADGDSIRAAVDRVRDLHGRLDGAFNNG